ncbi:MAG: hypothetical protein IPI27_13395 [Betaproteobacteria bacterium]|nr:hypothetical protein [Betaproteobacteria bacterium]
MAFTEPIASFFGTDDFAVTATLAGVSVTGIFDAQYYEPLGNDVQGSQPMFMLPTASAPSAAHGQTLVIGASTYKVRGVEPDGTGVTVLRLELQ